MSEQTGVATSAPGNPDTPDPTNVAPEGDPSLTRNEQPSHPFADPVANPGADPKVDAADSGATVGDSSGVGALLDHVQSQVDAEHEAGFRGHNPDPNSNESYTVGGVTSAPDLREPRSDGGLAGEGTQAVTQTEHPAGV